MNDIITIGLIQAHHDTAGDEPVEVHKRVAIEKHVRMIREAAQRGAKIVCLQELFYGPYFCAEQNPKWYESTEHVPDGPTTRLMQDLARELGIALVVPLYERTISGVYYNTAGRHRRRRVRARHLPQAPHPAGGGGSGRLRLLGEVSTSSPAITGYPTFQTKFARIGVYIVLRPPLPGRRAIARPQRRRDRVQPVGNGRRASEYLWKLEQPAHAVANGYYVAAINRVGFEAPWNMGEFYGRRIWSIRAGSSSNIGSRDKDEVVIGDMDRRLIEEVRNTWQFYRDRRPETYGDMVEI